MKINEVSANISTINKFLLRFKENVCSNIPINEDYNISWILTFNNKNSFNISKCYAKTNSGNQCKRKGGYCNRPDPELSQKVFFPLTFGS